MWSVREKHPILNMHPVKRRAAKWMGNLMLRPLVFSLDTIRVYKSFQKQLNRNFPLANLYRRSFGDYQVSKHDVLICTYPKSGTNWMLQMVFQLANDGEGTYDHIHDVTPWPDGETLPAVPLTDLTAALNSSAGVRPIKTHLAWDAVPYHPEAYYIYIVRDPKDILVSSYHFVRDVAMGPLMPSLRTWHQLFIENPFMLGSWAEHVASYWRNRQKSNMLWFSYEEMKADSNKVIHRVADFLSIPLRNGLLEKVKEKSSFHYMRQIDHKFHPGPALPFSPANGLMLRQGKTGASREALTARQRAQIDDAMIAQLKHLNCDFPYEATYL